MRTGRLASSPSSSLAVSGLSEWIRSTVPSMRGSRYTATAVSATTPTASEAKRTVPWNPLASPVRQWRRESSARLRYRNATVRPTNSSRPAGETMPRVNSSNWPSGPLKRHVMPAVGITNCSRWPK